MEKNEQAGLEAPLQKLARSKVPLTAELEILALDEDFLVRMDAVRDDVSKVMLGVSKAITTEENLERIGSVLFAIRCIDEILLYYASRGAVVKTNKESQNA
jgi:hypothetical protein